MDKKIVYLLIGIIVSIISIALYVYTRKSPKDTQNIGSGEPSGQPTVIPSGQPTVIPSGQPTVIPSGQPSNLSPEERQKTYLRSMLGKSNIRIREGFFQPKDTSLPPPPPQPPAITNRDCVVSAWSSWGNCDPRTQKNKRTRTIISQKQGSGLDCPNLTEEVSCVFEFKPEYYDEEKNQVIPYEFTEITDENIDQRRPLNFFEWQTWGVLSLEKRKWMGGTWEYKDLLLPRSITDKLNLCAPPPELNVRLFNMLKTVAEIFLRGDIFTIIDLQPRSIRLMKIYCTVIANKINIVNSMYADTIDIAFFILEVFSNKLNRIFFRPSLSKPLKEGSVSAIKDFETLIVIKEIMTRVRDLYNPLNTNKIMTISYNEDTNEIIYNKNLTSTLIGRPVTNNWLDRNTPGNLLKFYLQTSQVSAVTLAERLEREIPQHYRDELYNPVNPISVLMLGLIRQKDLIKVEYWDPITYLKNPLYFTNQGDSSKMTISYFIDELKIEKERNRPLGPYDFKLALERKMPCSEFRNEFLPSPQQVSESSNEFIPPPQQESSLPPPPRQKESSLPPPPRQQESSLPPPPLQQQQSSLPPPPLQQQQSLLPPPPPPQLTPEELRKRELDRQQAVLARGSPSLYLRHLQNKNYLYY